MNSGNSSAKALTVFSLVMITIVSVDSIRNLPAAALFGSQLIFFFLLGTVFFLLPCALISAELASGWPKQGGVYVWVKEAFGSQVGFLAIWFQWIENVIWYPTILSFVAGTIGYLINPHLVDDKFFLIAVILCSFWGATFINLFGMKSSALFSNLCALAGLLLPMILIIALGVAWLASGKLSQIQFHAVNLMPHLGDKTIWVSLTGIILSFCGVEIATVHANDVENPQRAFPAALMYSTAIIVGTLILGALSIAVVIPPGKISLVAGIMQAFNVFFTNYHMHWILPLIALMLVFGGLGGVSNWIIAPTKGLLVAAQDGNLPPFLQKENRYQAPSSMLIAQAIIVSILTLAFLLMPSVNGSYWLLTALAAQLYMLMYLMLFVTGIYLRYKAPHVERAFSIPGGNFGMWITALFGIIGATTTIVVSFIPPTNIKIGTPMHYETLLILGLILMCLPPFISYHLKKSEWQLRDTALT